jgi:hypothetical protein
MSGKVSDVASIRPLIAKQRIYKRSMEERRGDVENVETAVTAGLRVSAREQFCAVEHIGPFGRSKHDRTAVEIGLKVGLSLVGVGFGCTNLPTAILDCRLPNCSSRRGQPIHPLQFSEDFHRFRNFVDRIRHGRQTILEPRQEGLLILWRQTGDLGFDSQERTHDCNVTKHWRCVNGGFE